MYGIAGERRLVEWEVPWLPGFRNSSPVRIGNGAHSQLQLDVFGEVMDALHQARRGGIGQSDDGWAVQIAFLKHLETAWTEPDESIWEVRSGRRHFTYSKVMAWVAFDRAIKSAEEYRARRPARALARDAHGHPRRCVPEGLRSRSSRASCSPMAARSSMRACCCCRWSASCRRRTRA